MTQHETEPPKDLLYRESPETHEKLERFRGLSPDQLHLIFDFDRTLTVPHPGADDNVTTWHILNEHLPPNAQGHYQKLFEHYRPLEMSGELTDEQAITWWSSILNLFVENGIDMREVEADFVSKASIRPGAKELLELCKAHGIPTIILSAGIRNVIELWAKHYGISPDVVMSTELQLDSDQRISGWDPSTLVHALNKHEIDHPDIRQILAERPNVIIVGDSVNDTNMAQGKETVFRYLIDDRGLGVQALAQEAFDVHNFDCIISDHSLDAIADIVHEIVS